MANVIHESALTGKANNIREGATPSLRIRSISPGEAQSNEASSDASVDRILGSELHLTA